MSVKFNIRGYVDRRTQQLKEFGEAIEQRRLKTITVKPISRPLFNNRGVRDFATWRDTNLQALTDYWNSLTAAGDTEILGEEDFHLFTLVQHERELDHMEDLREKYTDRTDYTAEMGAQ
jgi:hypothetical protein